MPRRDRKVSGIGGPPRVPVLTRSTRCQTPTATTIRARRPEAARYRPRSEAAKVPPGLSAVVLRRKSLSHCAPPRMDSCGGDSDGPSEPDEHEDVHDVERPGLSGDTEQRRGEQDRGERQHQPQRVGDQRQRYGKAAAERGALPTVRPSPASRPNPRATRRARAAERSARPAQSGSAGERIKGLAADGFGDQPAVGGGVSGGAGIGADGP